MPGADYKRLVLCVLLYLLLPRMCACRTGRVEMESVNCVLVDELQATGFQRMAIGASVALDPSGFKVRIRSV